MSGTYLFTWRNSHSVTYDVGVRGGRVGEGEGASGFAMVFRPLNKDDVVVTNLEFEWVGAGKHRKLRLSEDSLKKLRSNQTLGLTDMDFACLISAVHEVANQRKCRKNGGLPYRTY